MGEDLQLFPSCFWFTSLSINFPSSMHIKFLLDVGYQVYSIDVNPVKLLRKAYFSVLNERRKQIF